MAEITKLHDDIERPKSAHEEQVDRLWGIIAHCNQHIVGLYELLDESITELSLIRDGKWGAKTLDHIIDRFDDVLIGNDYYVNKAEEEAKSKQA